MTDINEVIKERQNVHGDWSDNARISQSFKTLIRYELEKRKARGQHPLTDVMRDGLEMIAHKMGRIISGAAHEAEHWLDISGYATVTAQRLETPPEKPETVKQMPHRVIGIGTMVTNAAPSNSAT